MASAMPPTETVLLLTNPEPETVRVVALEPAGTLAGLRAEIAGVEGVLFPPLEPEPLPELEPPPPPHPRIS